MQHKFFLVSGLMLMCHALSAPAGDLADARLIKIGTMKTYGEILFIKTDKTKTSLPGCHVNLAWDYVMPLVSEHDKKLYSMLLAARAADTPITLNGGGTCEYFGSIETLIGVTW